MKPSKIQFTKTFEYFHLKIFFFALIVINYSQKPQQVCFLLAQVLLGGWNVFLVLVRYEQMSCKMDIEWVYMARGHALKVLHGFMSIKNLWTRDCSFYRPFKELFTTTQAAIKQNFMQIQELKFNHITTWKLLLSRDLMSETLWSWL